MAINKLSIIKFLEWVFTIACLGLHYQTMSESDQVTRLLTAGTFVGFTIILIALFAGYLMNTPINKRLDLFFSLIGCALFIACGALIIKEWENAWNKDDKRMAMAKGSISIINGVVFFIDVIRR
ncbi:unnamed protein product [Hermetia illucens]|uniref:DUF7775 domain-containing protein n=1 Tax=Hermetia illucens TaxID=343691 RepID=A0A7R8UZI0_HERIL|nr:unnamed protein product [Hermetia illucens]